MSQAITRLYRTSSQAADAVKKLQACGFADDLITHIEPGSSTNREAITQAIMAGYVLKSEAKIYADRVLAGDSLVSIVPPFGVGGYVLEILERYGPVDSGVSHQAPFIKWDDATVFSSALHIPVLLKGTAVFSTFWNLPVLLKSGRTLSSVLGIPSLSNSSLTAPSKFGIPLLSSREVFFPAPLLASRARSR